MSEELRCYTFTNFMLSPIQQGIQSGHAAMELVNKYMVDEGWVNGMAEYVASWVSDYKTIVCLNGGNNAGVEDIYAFLHDDENPYPYAPFHEDEQSLSGVMTSVAMILPARIFEGAAVLRRQKWDQTVSVTWDHLLEELRVSWANEDDTEFVHETYTRFERDLMNRLNQMQLAR